MKALFGVVLPGNKALKIWQGFLVIGIGTSSMIL